MLSCYDIRLDSSGEIDRPQSHCLYYSPTSVGRNYFSARNTTALLLRAARFAACFENANATNTTGPSDLFNFVSNVITKATFSSTNTIGNGTETVWHNIKTATNSQHGLPAYFVLVSFLIVAILVLLVEWRVARTDWGSRIVWGLFAMSFSCTITSLGLFIHAWVHYHTLTRDMEVPALYQRATSTSLTLSKSYPSLFSQTL